MQKYGKDSDHIHITVYSKVELLQPSGSHIDQNNPFPVTQQLFVSQPT